MGYNLVAIPKQGEDLPPSTEMHRRMFAEHWTHTDENAVRLQPVDVRDLPRYGVQVWRGIRFEDLIQEKSMYVLECALSGETEEVGSR